METKLFEVRDSCTFIPCIGIKISGADGGLARRAGYGPPCILFGRLDGVVMLLCCDPYDWTGARTLQRAHAYLCENWDDHVSGDVIDVEFILGETAVKKESEL